MRRIASRPLWIGHAGDVRSPGPLLQAGVAAVVELAASEPMAELPRELLRLRFPLLDGAGNPTWMLRLAVGSLASLVRADLPTLVACSAGMSRSVALTAAALSLVERRPFANMLAEIASAGPSDVSPALASELQTLLG